ncbi:UNVERIFIED_ORG: hypothetical protein BDU10_3469 [Burkholderia sp. CF145]
MDYRAQGTIDRINTPLDERAVAIFNAGPVAPFFVTVRDNTGAQVVRGPMEQTDFTSYSSAFLV